MNLEVQEATDRFIRFRLEGSSAGFVNALRRTLMMEVPKLAIEEVTIYDNKSALFDEIIAQRLGMLPVPTDPGLFAGWEPEEREEDEEEPEELQVLYTLTYEGPGTVYAKDLQPATGEEALQIADPDVPIVKLGQDQRLMLEATARLGRGRDHAKWQPVVGAGYRKVPTVDVTGPLGLDDDEAQELASRAPEGALSFDGDEVDEITDEIAAHDFLYNIGTSYGIENVDFGQRDDAFIFEFETDGALTPKDALREAVRILMEKLKRVQEKTAALQ